MHTSHTRACLLLLLGLAACGRAARLGPPTRVQLGEGVAKDDFYTTQIKLRGEQRAVRRPIIGPVNRNFNQILAKLSPETQGRVLIARADVEVEPGQTLAKVIQHNSEVSPYVRTVVIQNTPQ